MFHFHRQIHVSFSLARHDMDEILLKLTLNNNQAIVFIDKSVLFSLTNICFIFIDKSVSFSLTNIGFIFTDIIFIDNSMFHLHFIFSGKLKIMMVLRQRTSCLGEFI